MHCTKIFTTCKDKFTTPDEEYGPLASSNDTLAEYKNPFGFSLQVVQSTVDMVIGLGNNGTEVGSVRFSTSQTTRH
jgi:hypothetical protein